jgi:hypothetical protein
MPVPHILITCIEEIGRWIVKIKMSNISAIGTRKFYILIGHKEMPTNIKYHPLNRPI